MVGKVEVDVNAMNIDLASISSHKVCQSTSSSNTYFFEYFNRSMDQRDVGLCIFVANLVCAWSQSSLVVDKKED
jgi:hypothetical protein